MTIFAYLWARAHALRTKRPVVTLGLLCVCVLSLATLGVQEHVRLLNVPKLKKCLVEQLNRRLDTVRLFKDDQTFYCQAEAAVRTALLREAEGIEGICGDGETHERILQIADELLSRATLDNRIQVIEKAIDKGLSRWWESGYVCPWPQKYARANEYRGTDFRSPCHGKTLGCIGTMRICREEKDTPPWWEQLDKYVPGKRCP